MENSSEIKKLLGKRIKELRNKKGLTQEKFAEIMGIGERNFSKIECGNNFLTAETLSKIVNILGIETYELFQYNHLKDISELKEELIHAIKTENVDIELMYKFYKSIK